MVPIFNNQNVADPCYFLLHFIFCTFSRFGRSGKWRPCFRMKILSIRNTLKDIHNAYMDSQGHKDHCRKAVQTKKKKKSRCNKRIYEVSSLFSNYELFIQYHVIKLLSEGYRTIIASFVIQSRFFYFTPLKVTERQELLQATVTAKLLFLLSLTTYTKNNSKTWCQKISRCISFRNG